MDWNFCHIIYIQALKDIEYRGPYVVHLNKGSVPISDTSYKGDLYLNSQENV